MLVYRYRLSPTRAQERVLHRTLGMLRELYNAALQERRDAYRQHSVSLTAYGQMAELREVREVRSEYADVHTHLLQDVITRLDRAYRAFFRRIKVGEKPGFPRFQGIRSLPHLHRDVNAAKNVQARGHRVRGGASSRPIDPRSSSLAL